MFCPKNCWTVLKVYLVGFAESCSNLIGQLFYKSRRILGRVASVAGALAAATLAHLGGVQSLGPPRLGNPVEGNGLHTRLKGLSHHVVGRAVNCPLSGPAWEEKLLLFSRVREQISCTVCVHNMAELVSSSLYSVYSVYTLQLKPNWFPAVQLYSTLCTACAV